ncbi:MAG: molybdate ABC transporter substrate-binding protein [Desulfurivibrionaceae bacterium]
MSQVDREITEYPEIPENRSDDLHNSELLDKADLILFMAGNQFMLMPEMINAFQARYPEVENIYYQTLPPGLEFQEILAGGARFRGRSFRIEPDIYSSVSAQAMESLVKKGIVSPDDYFVYLRNKLALMVQKGNPRSIQSPLDLGREEIVVSQPNPEYEHIAGYITAMYEQVGGRELVHKIMEEKKAGGTTLLTRVHHRETPRRLLRGEADAGPVWYTEIIEAGRVGLEVQGVEVAREFDQRDAVNYFIAPLHTGRNQDNTEKFLHFIKSEPAREIFRKFGFITDMPL